MPSPVAALASLTRASERVRVLVVDDTEDIRHLLKVVLDLDGRFDIVAEAGDGAAGVEACRAHHPDLVLLDLAMPVMDGLQALTEIRRIWPTPPPRVVVLSGFVAELAARRALDLGADAYLEKGNSFAGLVPLLSEVCQLGPGVARTRPNGGRERRLAALPGEEATEVVAFVAHELKNPITVIEGFSTLLVGAVDRLERDTVIEAAAAIQRQSRHLAAILEAFSHARLVEVGAVEIRVEEVDLAALVRQVVADLKPITDQHDVTVQAVPTPARIDPGAVRQILTNLVSNAAKYSAPDRPIKVTVDPRHREIRVEVIDHWPGVPVGREDELFGKFARLGATSTTGVGLGLYISHGLARSHGGDLTYTRPPGGGSCFTLVLPVD